MFLMDQRALTSKLLFYWTKSCLVAMLLSGWRKLPSCKYFKRDSKFDATRTLLQIISGPCCLSLLDPDLQSSFQAQLYYCLPAWEVNQVDLQYTWTLFFSTCPGSQAPLVPLYILYLPRAEQDGVVSVHQVSRVGTAEDGSRNTAQSQRQPQSW